MKTYEQLMKHYWGVIVPMAEAAGVKPWECVRHVNEDEFTDHPKFEGKPWNYTFALTVLEQRPLFKGDTVYWKIDGELFIWEDGELDNYSEDLTWTPPTKKRTFMINDYELNCPINDTNGCRLDFLGVDYYFKSMRDRNKVASVINNILHTARDKE